MEILMQTGLYTVAVKEPGMLAEDAGNAESTLPARLRAQALEAGKKLTVYTVHRLDREVGGVTVVANTPRAAAALTKALTEKRFVKEYVAVTEGIPAAPEAVLTDLLFRDAGKNKTYVVDRPRRGVREASLAYTLLGTAEWEGSPISLLRVRLYTGRTHQIRAQFASRRLPLFGDGRYGSRVRAGAQGRSALALFAFSLGFPDPGSGKFRTFTRLPDRTEAPYSCFPAEVWEKLNALWEAPSPVSGREDGGAD